MENKEEKTTIWDAFRIKSLDGCFIPEDTQKRLNIKIDREKGKLVPYYDKPTHKTD